MSAGPSPIGTVLDELVQALDRASAYNPQDQVAPAAVLWTDKDRQWEAVIPRLLEARPGLLALGPYVPEERSGPAIWLRCMLERALTEADWPEETVPVLYLPGVSRRDLRAVAECPIELQPLAEVQYPRRLVHAGEHAGLEPLRVPDLEARRARSRRGWR